MATPLPQRIGRYEILRELGRGAMGVVYQAKDPVLQRHVALKTISLAFAVTEQEREAYEARFLQEARAAAALSHPCIVGIHDLGVDLDAGTLYMALEFLRGKTLESIIAQGQPLDWKAALETVARVAGALHYAHAKGVIHRDIKPANVMVLASGEPKVMDFGVAKLEGGELTASGQVLGSPPYMSPEQVDGKVVDARSDLFSLGAVLFELLTGQRAFPGQETGHILMRVVYEDPPPPSTLVEGLPPRVDSAVARALAKDPNARYQSGKAFADEILDILAGRGASGDTVPAMASPTATGPSAAGQGTVRGGTGRGGGLAMLPGKRVSLVLLSGPKQGEMFVFSRPTALIGRSGGRAGADIELQDPEVSRAHAVVECQGIRVVMRDLGSTNGTFVGSERVQERELQDKSEFRVGGTRFMVVISADE